MKDNRTPIQLLSQLIADLSDYANERLVPHVDIYNAIYQTIAGESLMNRCRRIYASSLRKIRFQTHNF